MKANNKGKEGNTSKMNDNTTNKYMKERKEMISDSYLKVENNNNDSVNLYAEEYITKICNNISDSLFVNYCFTQIISNSFYRSLCVVTKR